MCGRRKNCFSRFRWNSNNFVLVVILYICARQTHLMVCVVHAFFCVHCFFCLRLFCIPFSIVLTRLSTSKLAVVWRQDYSIFVGYFCSICWISQVSNIFCCGMQFLHVLFVHKPVLLVKIHSCTKCSCSIKLSTYFPDCIFVAVVVAILYSTTFFVLRTLRNVAI